MRQDINDRILKLRFNEALVARTAALAERRGVSLSELVRNAVRRELEAA